MKPSRLTRIFALLLTLIIATGTVVAVLADITAGDVNGDGKITAFDAQMIAEKKAGLRTFSDDQAERAGVLSIQDILHMILNTPAEPTEPTEPAEPTEPSAPAEPTEPSAPAVDPNAIAAVTNDGQTEYVNSVSAMISSVAADGNTQIKLLKDIANTASAITFPYSCTIDFSGHTVTTNPNSGNCIEITKAGTENQTTTIKNGTMLYNQLGLRVAQGAFMIENMKMHGSVGAAVGLRDTTNYKDINRISNSTLSSGGWGCVAFHISPEDYSNTGYTIENSTLVSYLQSGANTLTRSGVAIPGTVTLGDNVNLYTYAANFAASGHVINGLPASQVSSSATVTVNGVTYTGLKHWRSGQVGTEDKTQDSIAQVVNGTKTRYVSSIADLTASVQSSGNTQIKLLKDISTDAPIIFPYSCSIDFDGYTVSTNPTTGNGIQITAAGTENKTTTIKNGTLLHNDVGLRVAQGAFIVDNMNIHATVGACVAIYDTTDYRHINRISNSTLSSSNWGCVVFNTDKGDFINTGFTVDHSTLISYKATGSLIFNRRDTANGGQITLGEQVELYSYSDKICTNRVYFNPTGKTAALAEESATVTVNNVTVENLNHWSTTATAEPIRVLMIGNSFCYRLVEELHGVARAAGYNLYIANLYEAGCYVQEHWTWLGNNSPNYELWVTNDMGRTLQQDIKTIGGALEMQDWDIITLQQHFDPQIAATQESALTSCTPYVSNLYGYIQELHPYADLYWHETWAYQVGHSQIPTTAAQTNQYANIRYVSQLVCEENNVPMIPCGDAWQLARSSVGDTLCLDDQYHDGDVGGGQYLNACVWLEVLTGKSCVGNTWRPTEYTLDETLVSKLQAAAHQAVADLYGADFAK